MGMIPVKCPNCGADIQLDDSREFGFCNYCGTKVIQEKVVVEHRGTVSLDQSNKLINLEKRIIDEMADVTVGTDVINKMCEEILEINPEHAIARFVSSLIYAANFVLEKNDGTLSATMIAITYQGVHEKWVKCVKYIKDNISDNEKQDYYFYALDNYHTCPLRFPASSYYFWADKYKDENNEDYYCSFLTTIEKNIERDIKCTSCNIPDVSLLYEGYSLLSILYPKFANRYNEKAKEYKTKYPNAKRVDKLYETSNSSVSQESSSGCYVATAVYGSYDCPEVWTLRRYRDNQLAKTWYGRLFIHTYYAISPTLVRWFGNTQWFKNMWKPKLDKMVDRLQKEGVENTPYQDRNW